MNFPSGTTQAEMNFPVWDKTGRNEPACPGQHRLKWTSLLWTTPSRNDFPARDNKGWFELPCSEHSFPIPTLPQSLISHTVSVDEKHQERKSLDAALWCWKWSTFTLAAQTRQRQLQRQRQLHRQEWSRRGWRRGRGTWASSGRWRRQGRFGACCRTGPGTPGWPRRTGRNRQEWTPGGCLTTTASSTERAFSGPRATWRCLQKGHCK